MKKLALLGAARPRYEEKVKNVLKRPECNKRCWTGWTYGINSSKLELLKKQFDKDKYFNIYYHDIKHPKNPKYGTGTGFVEYRLEIKEYAYTEEFVKSPKPECAATIDPSKPHRLHACVLEDPIKIQSKKWNTFIDYDTNNNIPHFRLNLPNVDFEYIIDPEM